LPAFPPRLLNDLADGAVGAPGLFRLAGEGKAVQGHIAGGLGGREADSRTALARQAFQVIPAETRQKRARLVLGGRSIAVGVPQGAQFGPPAVGAILDERAFRQAMQSNQHLRPLDPELARDLLRLQSRRAGEKLLDSVGVAHTTYSVSQEWEAARDEGWSAPGAARVRSREIIGAPTGRTPPLVAMRGGEPRNLRVSAGHPDESGCGAHECARHELPFRP